MILDKLARERERAFQADRDFWESFGEEFGRTGRPGWVYGDGRIYHIFPGITRANVGTLTPDDLMFALALFEAKYSGGE